MGLILFGSPPNCLTASRMAAKSTTAGTPVKSWSNEVYTRFRIFAINIFDKVCKKRNNTWRMTLAGLNATSTPSSIFWDSAQPKIFLTSSSFTWKLSQFLTADSNKILIEYGSLSTKKSQKIIYNSKKLWNNNIESIYINYILTKARANSWEVKVLEWFISNVKLFQKFVVWISCWQTKPVSILMTSHDLGRKPREVWKSYTTALLF